MGNAGNVHIVLFGVDIVGLSPNRAHECFDRFDRLRYGIVRCSKAVNRLTEQVRIGGCRTRFFRPAIGCPPTKLTVRGNSSLAQRQTSALVLATSVTTAPAGNRVASSWNTSCIARTGVATTTICASCTASASVRASRSIANLPRASRITRGSRSNPITSTAPSGDSLGSTLRNAIPSEVPIRPSPIIAIRIIRSSTLSRRFDADERQKDDLDQHQDHDQRDQFDRIENAQRG